MTYQVNHTFNSLVVQIDGKQHLARLADHINTFAGYNVTEIRYNVGANISSILVYPQNKQATRERLHEIVGKYFENHD